MPSFSVIITTNTTPAISIQFAGTSTYTQFKNSLGNYVYNVKEIYLFSNLLQQLQGSFGYSKYDSNGTQNLQTIVSAIDPYQYANAIYLNTSKKNLILDGRDTIKFNMLPNSILEPTLYCDRISVGDTLDLIGSNNFKDLEKASGKFNFFEEYNDIL